MVVLACKQLLILCIVYFSNNNHISDGSAQVDLTIIMVYTDVSTTSDGAINSAWYVKQFRLFSIKQVL